MSTKTALTSGAFNTGSNWVGGSAPSGTDVADTGGFDMTHASGTATCASIIGTGSLYLTGGVFNGNVNCNYLDYSGGTLNGNIDNNILNLRANLSVAIFRSKNVGSTDSNASYKITGTTSIAFDLMDLSNLNISFVGNILSYSGGAINFVGNRPVGVCTLSLDGNSSNTIAFAPTLANCIMAYRGASTPVVSGATIRIFPFTIKMIASGNFSDTTKWENAVVPGLSDSILIDNFICTVDQDITGFAFYNGTLDYSGIYTVSASTYGITITSFFLVDLNASIIDSLTIDLTVAMELDAKTITKSNITSSNIIRIVGDINTSTIITDGSNLTIYGNSTSNTIYAYKGAIEGNSVNTVYLVASDFNFVGTITGGSIGYQSFIHATLLSTENRCRFYFAKSVSTVIANATSYIGFLDPHFAIKADDTVAIPNLSIDGQCTFKSTCSGNSWVIGDKASVVFHRQPAVTTITATGNDCYVVGLGFLPNVSSFGAAATITQATNWTIKDGAANLASTWYTGVLPSGSDIAVINNTNTLTGTLTASKLYGNGIIIGGTIAAAVYGVNFTGTSTITGIVYGGKFSATTVCTTTKIALANTTWTSGTPHWTTTIATGIPLYANGYNVNLTSISSLTLTSIKLYTAQHMINNWSVPTITTSTALTLVASFVEINGATNQLIVSGNIYNSKNMNVTFNIASTSAGGSIYNYGTMTNNISFALTGSFYNYGVFNSDNTAVCSVNTNFNSLTWSKGAVPNKMDNVIITDIAVVTVTNDLNLYSIYGAENLDLHGYHLTLQGDNSYPIFGFIYSSTTKSLFSVTTNTTIAGTFKNLQFDTLNILTLVTANIFDTSNCIISNPLIQPDGNIFQTIDPVAYTGDTTFNGAITFGDSTITAVNNSMIFNGKVTASHTDFVAGDNGSALTNGTVNIKFNGVGTTFNACTFNQQLIAI